ncbi:hypothetical protein ACH69B_21775 [Klebsiella aerogenes]|nr:hypothetical protein [Klebsiella aerogenes]HBR6957416.1 hypothetical protein [Klebsiella aerogenes]
MEIGDVTQLSDEELNDYLNNYVWYAISADDRLRLGEELRRREALKEQEV